MSLDFMLTRKPEGQTHGLEFVAEDDLDLCLYYLRTLSNILRWAPDALWDVLAKRTIHAEEHEPPLPPLSRYPVRCSGRVTAG